MTVEELEQEQMKEMQEHREFCTIAENKVKELTHRAEVAEKALEIACIEYFCYKHEMDYHKNRRAKHRNLMKQFMAECKEQAEKELAKEKKDD